MHRVSVHSPISLDLNDGSGCLCRSFFSHSRAQGIQGASARNTCGALLRGPHPRGARTRRPGASVPITGLCQRRRSITTCRGRVIACAFLARSDLPEGRALRSIRRRKGWAARVGVGTHVREGGCSPIGGSSSLNLRAGSLAWPGREEEAGRAVARKRRARSRRSGPGRCGWP
jgi:hypothetical protein